MTTILLTIHISACIFLIFIILLQQGKGADMGASFGGGGSQALFGSAGPATFLTKITTVIAVIFMLTSLSLAYRSGHRSFSSVMPNSGQVPVEQQATKARPSIPITGKAVKAKPSVPVKTGSVPVKVKTGTDVGTK